MKKLLTSIFLMLVTLFAAFPVLAGPAENITGCATVPIPGTNGTQRVDPNCKLSDDNTGASDLIVETIRSLLE